MSVIIDTKSAEALSYDSCLHLIPCEIEHNGPAQVKKYFSVSQSNSESEGEAESNRESEFRCSHEDPEYKGKGNTIKLDYSAAYLVALQPLLAGNSAEFSQANN